MNHHWKTLRNSSLITIVTHFVGGISMLLILRHGLETNTDFNDRLRFLVDHKALWIAGWIPWSIAALSILYFYGNFANAHKNSKNYSLSMGLLVFFLTVVAVALDFKAQKMEILLIPDLAQKALANPSASASFLAVHRKAMMLTGFAANGLYSLSALLLVRMTWKFYANWIRIAGLCVGVVGLAASGMVFVNSVNGMLWTNAILVPCILIWQLGIVLTHMKK